MLRRAIILGLKTGDRFSKSWCPTKGVKNRPGLNLRVGWLPSLEGSRAGLPHRTTRYTQTTSQNLNPKDAANSRTPTRIHSREHTDQSRGSQTTHTKTQPPETLRNLRNFFSLYPFTDEGAVPRTESPRITPHILFPKFFCLVRRFPLTFYCSSI